MKRRHHRWHRSRAVVAAIVMTLVVGACSADPDILSPGERAGGTDAAAPMSPRPAPTPTATPIPTAIPVAEPTVVAPVKVDVADVVRTRVGESVTFRVDVETPPGTGPVEIDLLDGPVGVAAGSSWQPDAPGAWYGVVVVTDAIGRSSRHPVRFVARHTASSDAVVAIGDSVASGHGLEITDYLGADECFRSNDGYPRLATKMLVERGMLPPASSAVVLACSGADVAALVEDDVAGGRPAWGGSGERMSQVDWVLRSNPAVVFVTIGINDIGFVDPARLIPAGRLDRKTLATRLEAMRDQLADVVEIIVDGTDAEVFVTGYYNPAAARPHGVDGCAGACFRAASAEVVEALNAAIADALPPDPRVRFVDIAPRFDAHGAPNGIGLDSARAGEGVLGRLVGGVFEDIHPYCARGDSAGITWVNSLDCVHPNDAGHVAIASAITQAW